jgi:uncharacterized membrane protein
MTGASPPGAPDDPTPSLSGRHAVPHAVPWRHALAWFEEGMRLFKRAPGTWIALAFCALATELGLTALPEVGTLLAQLVAPLVAGGLVYAAAATDRGDAPLLRHAAAAFAAPVGALIALIVTSLVAFAGQGFAAWWLADANLLVPAAESELSGIEIVGVVTTGVLASLPVTFVPFLALLEGAPFGAAFRASWNAFALNTLPLVVYGTAALGLVGLGVATMGLGLLLALPLLATASYAAWKDIFGADVAPP